MIRLRPPALGTLGFVALGLGILSCDSSPTGPVVASVQVTAPAEDVRVGMTLQLTATPRDASGNPVQGQTISWSSSDDALATVSTSGLVSGVAEGQVMITAEATQITGRITLQVVNPPAITSVEPSALEPGMEFIVHGERFSPTLSNNEVWVLGARSTVLEASGTFLRARVPDFACGAEGPAPIVVASGGQLTDPFEHPFLPSQELDLDVGEIHLFAAPDFRCLSLAASLTGRTYLVGVQSGNPSPTARTLVRIRGFRGQASVSLSEPALSDDAGAPTMEPHGPSLGGEGRVALRDGSGGPRARRWLDHRRDETRLRAEERRQMAPVIRSAHHHAAFSDEAGSAVEGRSVPAGAQVGDTIPIRVPDLNGSICSDFQTVSSVVRRVGTRSIWLEDLANPSGGLTSDDYDFLSDEFDNEIYAELVSHFGEPTDLDGNERIVVLITRRVNEMRAGTLGFVVTTDFFPGSCNSSNGGEVYYARAPDPEGAISDPDGQRREYSREDARSDAPLILAHEVTHIIQFGRRLIQNQVPSLEELWIMEGQATLAEEVVGFRYTGHAPRSNLSRQTAFGDHAPGGVDWFRNAFIDLAIFYGVAFDSNDQPFRLPDAPHACAWLDFRNPEPCISERIGYGVTWSFLRWLSDHVASDPREFQRQIIESVTAGMATLSQVAGTDVIPLLAPWAASLYVDGRLLSGDPRLSFPSWDLRDIEEGLIPEARLAPEERSFTSFQREAEVAAGSTTYQIFRASLGHPPFAVSALTPAGQELPATMQLWVVRLQ
jgi:hypothetical protein